MSMKKKKWIIIETITITTCIALSFLGVTNIMIIAGVLMLVSPWLLDKMYSCELLNWLSMEVISPKSKYNPYIFGFLFIIIGFAYKFNSQHDAVVRIFEKDYSFFFLNALVIIFAFMAAKYSAKK